VTTPVFGLVGALGAVPRRIAARDAGARGWTLHRGTTRATTHAVFGHKLLCRLDDPAIVERIAAERDAGRVIVSEAGFLRRLRGEDDVAEGGEGLPGLSATSGLTLADLGFLAAFDAFSRDRAPFALPDVILARKYAGLVASGATLGAIARALHRSGDPARLTAQTLRAGGPGAIYADAGPALAELDGQLLLGFGEVQDDADDLFAAAETAEAGGAFAAAADLYARCLACDPTDAIAAYNRANCLRVAGRTGEAQASYLEALRRDPGLVEAWFNLAGLLGETGRAAAARRYLRRAISIDRDYADAVFNLAALAFQAGDADEARASWTRYLELDPSSDWARRARRGLSYLDGARHATV
jgi:hypothetical protein